MQCTAYVAHDALQSSKMRLLRIVHEEAHLLNCIRQVGSSQCEVLKSASETPVLRLISNRGAIRRGELGPSVNRCRCRVTLGHAGTAKEIHSILALRQEQPV